MSNKNSIQSSEYKRLDKEIKELEAKLKIEKAKQRFVSFSSPGSFFDENTGSSIKDPTDLAAICKKAKKIKERYNASPYGFTIVDGNGKSLSGMYFITGELSKYDDIIESVDTSILRSNMRCNDWPYIVTNTNSYKSTRSFDEKDCIVNWNGDIVIKGDSAELMKYRRAFAARRKKYYEKYPNVEENNF